jgi:carbon monoxide dehydrogenase subunit G
VDERHYEITLEQRVAFLTARFDARLQLQEVRPPESVSFVLEGKDGRIASSIKVGTTISLRDTGTGQTEVMYRNDMSVFGRLGAIGFAAIKRKAQDVQAEFARRANAALSGVPGESRATV